MAKRIAALDWSSTSLGPSKEWPVSLRTGVDLMVRAKTPIAIYWGSESVVLYNDAWRALIGNKHPGALGATVEEVFPEMWPRIRPAFENLRANGEAFEAQDYHFPLNRHGEIEDAYFDFSLSPIPLSDGSVGGIFNLAVEVTERVRMASALGESRAEIERQAQFLDTTLSHIGDYVYVWDREEKFVYANERLEQLWGVAPGEWAGKRLSELKYPAALREKLERQVREVIETAKGVTGTTEYTSPTGRPGFYEYMLNPLMGPDGRVEFVAGVSHDVTERKQSEEAFRRSEARYRTLFESIGEGFCVFEMLLDDEGRPFDYRWLETNPAFSRHTGLVDAVGKTARELVPDLEPHWFEIYGRVAVTGESTRFEEHSPAMDRWFEVEAFRVGEPEERKVGLLFTDITDRKEAEEALALASRRKSEFLATLAHELRNPLAPIRAGAEVIKLAQDDVGMRMQACETIERQTRQLVILVDDLLDVSRIDRGCLELRRSRVRLSDVVNSSVEAAEPLIAEAGHNLTVDVPANPIYLDADPHRLAQVISNLLNNAVRYTPEGGDISLSATVDEEGVAITVEDSGIGIQPETLERIFEMFAQADPSEKNGYGGLGIGLTLAKSLIEMHGGEIEARSAGAGEGSAFTIRVPGPVEHDEEEKADSEPAPVSSKDREALRVLVVDDNQAAAQMLSMVIGMRGSEVRTAHDGREGLEVAAEFRPAVILLDLGMPEMDGFEAARRIRQEPWGQDVRLIALSGWGQEEDKRDSKAAGFDYHLVKPADPADLDRLLSEVTNPA